MLTSPTIDKLNDLNLFGMTRAYQQQLERADHQALSFDERLGLLVDEEMQERETRRLFRYLKSAKLRDQACIEDIDFHLPRHLDRTLIRELVEARWVDAHQVVLIIGATGLGKTYIACALAEAAIRKGHSALYMRFPRMIDEMSVARIDGRLPRLLSAWARVEVMVLDDWAMQPLTSQQSADLLEVIDDRSKRRSTILTSQMPVKQWHEVLGDATTADAILDRVVHGAHRIVIQGQKSLRDLEATSQNSSLQANTARSSERRRDRKPTEAL
jgi:DNA replication protein DnaC